MVSFFAIDKLNFTVGKIVDEAHFFVATISFFVGKVKVLREDFFRVALDLIHGKGQD